MVSDKFKENFASLLCWGSQGSRKDVCPVSTGPEQQTQLWAGSTQADATRSERNSEGKCKNGSFAGMIMR